MEKNRSDNLKNYRITKCRKNILWQFIILESLFFLAFITGYFIDPQLIRAIWLILSGTLFILTGIFFYFCRK